MTRKLIQDMSLDDIKIQLAVINMHSMFDASRKKLVESARMLDNNPFPEIEVLMEESSSRWLGAVDRTELGFFALPLDVLLSFDALLKVLYDDSKKQEAQPERGSAANENLGRLNMTATLISARAGVFTKASDPFDPRMVELRYWWEKTTGQEYYGVRVPEQESGSRKRMERIHLVAANTEMHPYFELGIWDVRFIEKCLTDGVDPEIARVLKNRRR